MKGTGCLRVCPESSATQACSVSCALLVPTGFKETKENETDMKVSVSSPKLSETRDLPSRGEKRNLSLGAECPEQVFLRGLL